MYSAFVSHQVCAQRIQATRGSALHHLPATAGERAAETLPTVPASTGQVVLRVSSALTLVTRVPISQSCCEH